MNRLIVEIQVDGEGRATAALKGVGDEADRFTAKTNEAGKAGLSLKDVFAGNILADFFKRGVDAAINFGAEAVRASAAASDANRTLEFTATQAGLAYTRAAELAEDFGKRVGASNTEAARTFADLLRLADRAGRVGDIDLIQRRFADLAAARGLKGAELSTLVGTILSGQDEGLNRLGLPDPSKLYAQYAAQIGKTADALTEMEKAQAALSGVMAKGAEAEGQAEARLRSTAGQLDSASASYENLKTQVGEAITTSIEFRDVLDTISDALGSLVTSHAEARRELALGLKTPEQIAQEEREGYGRQAFNAFKGVASAVFSIPFTIKDDFQLAAGQISDEEYNTNLQGTGEAILNPGQRQYEARVAQLKELQEEIKRQEQEAQNKASAAAASAAAKEQARLQAEAAKAAAEAEKKTLEALRQTRDEARSFLTDSLIKSDPDNPLLALFVRAQVEIEETRKKFQIFGSSGSSFANEMARIREEELKTEIAVARFQAGLTALKQLQEANRLERPFVGLTGPEQRALDVFGARVAAATSGVSGAGQAEALRAGLTSVDPAILAGRQFEALKKLESQISLAGGRGSAAARDALDAQLKALFASLPDALKANVASNPTLREAFAGAFSRDADRARREVEDAIERERAGNLIQQDARELLAAIRGSALTDAQKLKEFLSVTGALSAGELTGDLRRARVDALRESARLEAGKAEEAEARAKKLAAVMEKLDRALSDRGLKLDAESSKVQIEVLDRSDLARVSTLGDGFSAF